jgi:pSer/pThr/pTyr-binding forkhead associated (FHA) protein
MNLPEEPSSADLAAAAQTVRCLKFETDSLRKRLAEAAILLRALPTMPVVPSLVFRRPGEGRVECVPISAGIVLGRGEGCEIRFQERHEFSRRHFAVRPYGQGFVVEDLGSSNGITVAGGTGKIERRELRDGDLIQAGGVDFLFVRPEPGLLLEALPTMPAVPSLLFCRPGGGGVECVSVGSGVVVGRGEGCEIRFQDGQEFSRRHFALRPVEHGFIVEDLGSSNSTMVNGVAGKIDQHDLRDGDFIHAGGVDFLFVRPE